MATLISLSSHRIVRTAFVLGLVGFAACSSQRVAPQTVFFDALGETKEVDKPSIGQVVVSVGDKEKQKAQEAENLVLAELRTSGLGARFVIPAIRPAVTGRVASYTVVDGATGALRDPAPGCKFVTLLAEYPKDEVPFGFAGRGILPAVDASEKYPGNYGIQVCGELDVVDRTRGPSAGTEAEGTVWRFRGKHLYKGIVFEGDNEAPLAFLFHAQGFVYLTGKGRVVQKDGTVANLPATDAKK